MPVSSIKGDSSMLLVTIRAREGWDGWGWAYFEFRYHATVRRRPSEKSTEGA